MATDDATGPPQEAGTPAGYPLDHRRGYAPIPRDAISLEPLVRDHSMLAVWIFLHLRARHTAGWAQGSHGPVWLERGQCIAGLRDIGDQIGVGKNVVDRSLRDLERLGLVTRRSGQLGTVVSIENYGEFGAEHASGRDSDGTATGQPEDSAGTPTGTASGQRQDLRNGRTGKRKNRKTDTPELPASPPLNALLHGEQRGGQQEQGAEENPPVAPAPPPGPPASKATAKNGGKGSDHQRVVQRWTELYAERYGGDRPTWGKKRGEQVKQLLKQHSADEVIAKAESLMSSPPSWLKEDEGRITLGTLLACYDQLGGRRPTAQTEEWRRKRDEELERMPAFDKPLPAGYEDWRTPVRPKVKVLADGNGESVETAPATDEAPL